MVRHEARLRARVFVRGVRGLPCGLRFERQGHGRRRRFDQHAGCLDVVRCRSKGRLERDGRSGRDRRRRRLGDCRRCEWKRRGTAASSRQGAVLPRHAVRRGKDVRGHGPRGLLPRVYRGHLQRFQCRPVQFRHVQCFVYERRRLCDRASLQCEWHVHPENVQWFDGVRRHARLRRRLLQAHQMHRGYGLSLRDSMPKHPER
jgi:hypothetical protein